MTGKTLLTSSLLILIFCHTAAGFPYPKKEKAFLTVTGKITNERGTSLSDYAIKVYVDNDLIETLVAEKSFKLALKENNQYTVEILKPGHHPKRIGINTTIAREKEDKESYLLMIEATIYKKEAGVDSYYFDFPAALITYDSRTFTFSVNQKYISHIRAKIKSEYSATTLN